MASGPSLIFDKSTLESLNQDEAVWLDNFFRTNITPLFFIETLADLEKEMRKRRCTPEDFVGTLASKTPDMHSRPNVHHGRLLLGEVLGNEHVAMDGRPIIAAGQVVVLEGHTGMIFHQAPEEEAFQRWESGQFLELERTTAKAWRAALSKKFDFGATYHSFQRLCAVRNKPKTLAEAKVLADALIDELNQREILRLGMQLLRLRQWKDQILERWDNTHAYRVREFSPYFSYVFSVAGSA